MRASFATSLANLGTTYVDALLLHSPLETYELTLRAWRVLEEFHAAGSARTLGVSNVAFQTFERLWNESTVKPGIVQNRFYNRTVTTAIWAFCQHNSVAYQGFWTITGNRNVVSGPVVAEIASRLGKPPVGVLPGPHAARPRRARRNEVDGSHARGPGSLGVRAGRRGCRRDRSGAVVMFCFCHVPGGARACSCAQSASVRGSRFEIALA